MRATQNSSPFSKPKSAGFKVSVSPARTPIILASSTSLPSTSVYVIRSCGSRIRYSESKEVSSASNSGKAISPQAPAESGVSNNPPGTLVQLPSSSVANGL